MVNGQRAFEHSEASGMRRHVLWLASGLPGGTCAGHHFTYGKKGFSVSHEISCLYHSHQAKRNPVRVVRSLLRQTSKNDKRM